MTMVLGNMNITNDPNKQEQSQKGREDRSLAGESPEINEKWSIGKRTDNSFQVVFVEKGSTEMRNS